MPLIDHHSLFLLLSALVAVIGLILLIAVVKLNPVITLFVVSLALAVVAGMPFPTIIHSFEAGVGGTLGHIAIIVALGTMLGKMMAESGAADQIAHTLIRLFGEKNVPWAMVFIGILVGLPAFFEVGFVLLVPGCVHSRATHTHFAGPCGSAYGCRTLGGSWPCASASCGNACGHDIQG